jgi:hypothetical protein
MKLPNSVPVWGNTKYRGDCPSETAEQVTFFNEIRRKYPDTWGRIATHIRNEGKKTPQQVRREKAEGMTKGASDIIVGGFYCELKRKDHTKSKIAPEQIEYLEMINQLGFYGCVALGWEAAMEAFEEWSRTS